MGRRLLCLLALLLWFLCVQHPASAYLTDALLHLPVDYFTFLPPALGGTYIDSIFSTQVKRLTDARNTRDNSTGGTLTFVRTEYATMSPFNKDNTRLLLQHVGYFALYDGAGHYIKDLPFAGEIEATSEPRWSRSDPNILYYHPVPSNQLKQYNVLTGAISVVHTFSEYSMITGAGESDISLDGGHFVLAGRTVSDVWEIFVYEISTDTKGPVLNTAGLGGFDQLYTTPDNNVLVGWLTDGPGRYQGLELYDSQMVFQRQVFRTISHMDVTRDLNGDEIVVATNSNEPLPTTLPTCYQGVIKIRLADAHQTCLLFLDWGMAIHVSAPDSGGWVLVGTYSTSDPDPLSPLGEWKPYMNELLQIKLDGSEVRRLVHHRSRPFNTYNWTPRASMSRDGAKLVYSSDYGLQQLLGYPSDYVDVYLIDRLDVATLYRNLSVAKTGNGRVTSNPAGIDCGTNCAEPYAPGTIVDLTATPNHPGEEFLNWDGACAGKPNPCQVMMDSAKVVTASFTSRTGGGGGDLLARMANASSPQPPSALPWPRKSKPSARPGIAFS